MINRNHLKQSLMWGVFLIIAAMFIGCNTTPERDYKSPIEVPIRPLNPEPLEPISTSQQEPFSATKTVENPTQPIEPPKPQESLAYGWLLTTADRDSTLSLLSQINEAGVTHVEIGGNVYNAIDDLIFDSRKGDYVVAVAQQLESQNIDTYLWGRELSVENKQFRFLESDPIIKARQAAYRMVLNNIPEIDGIVLTFEDARLAPWDVQTPVDEQSISTPQRIRFLIKAIKSVVVDELGKRLAVRLKTPSPEYERWFVQALFDFDPDELTLIIPSRNIQLPDNIFTHVWLETDLASLAAGFTLDELKNLQNNQKSNINGITVKVQSQQGRVVETPSDLHLFLVSSYINNRDEDIETLWIEWMNQRYSWLPSSREGSALLSIFETARHCDQHVAIVKDYCRFSFEGPVPSEGSLSELPFETLAEDDAQFKWVEKELLKPTRQTLKDISQETYQIKQQIVDAQSELEKLKNRLLPKDYQEIMLQLKQQETLIDLFSYGKQAYWGYLLWKRNWDEQEALHVEANLQRMEAFAEEMEQGNSLPGAVNANQLRAFTSRIREHYPRLIFGWRHRDWNHLQDIQIKQTGPDSVEVTWRSEEPATSRIFVADQLPIFELTMPASEYPETAHRCVVQGLQPGQQYHFRAQCTARDGDVINSGSVPFQLEGTPTI